MIKNETVKIILNPSNLKRYKELGYIGCVGDEIEVKICDLSDGSKFLVDVICDVCGVDKKVKYFQLVKLGYLKFYYCHKCKKEKILFEKHGVKNIFQLSETKEKIKKTCLEKYGVDNISKYEKIKELKKEKSIKNFGTEYPLSSHEIKEKLKKTCEKKYGVDNVSKLEFIKKKKEITCFKNNGVKYISQSEIFKKNIRNNILEYLKRKYDIFNYNDYEYTLKCEKCNSFFTINKKNFFTRHNLKVEICTICNPIGNFSVSGLEKKLKEYIQSVYDFEILYNERIIKQELDIYIPKMKLAFEFNGLYWHNELYKSNDYHLKKTEDCEKLGIHLIHIFEDDWIYKQDIIKSRILNLLGKSEKIYARKCEIKEIKDNKLIKDFLETNHLQGYVGAKIKLGLFYKDEIVSIMTFGKQRKPMGSVAKENNYEMLRFCNKLNFNVIGGASKLFRQFIKKYYPTEIISYADRSWSQGNLYEKLGFFLLKKTKPNYNYIIDGHRKYRFGFRKDILIKKGFEQKKSEHQIMLEKNIFRIYDSGHLKYSTKKPK